MSDLLLIVPESWTEIVNDPEWIGPVISVSDLSYMIEESSWGDIDNLLLSMVVLPAGKNTINAHLLNTESGYRFWVEYGI
jgi:hypothetical protein